MSKKDKNIVRKIVSPIVLFTNILGAIWLLLCFAASYINPIEIDYISLLSISIPFALLTNFIYAFFWLFTTHKLRSLVSIVPLLICFKIITAVFGLNLIMDDWSSAENHFKLISWNVHAMGTFNHPNEKEYADGIVRFIQSEQPDILCLPEFATNADSSKRIFLPRIMKENGYKKYFFNEDNDFGPQIRIGTVVFSKYPIINFKTHQLSRYIFMSQCDTKLPTGKTISVCVVHLRSFMLTDEDKAVIEEATEKKSWGIDISNSFIYKLNKAYILRAAEAERAASVLNKIQHPIIVCGDFNDLPYSYTYKTIKGNLKDAFASNGLGLGRSYNQIFPTLRIDYVFYDADHLSPIAFKTPKTTYSDHNPIVVNFKIID